MIVIYLAFLHLIADFVLQDREMGKKKSEKLQVLVHHCFFQFWVFYGGLILLDYDSGAIYKFVLLNALVHGVIDWNIWRVYKKFTMWQVKLGKRQNLTGRQGHQNTEYRYWDDHYFYLTIGIDQFLHLATIVGLWYFIVGG